MKIELYATEAEFDVERQSEGDTRLIITGDGVTISLSVGHLLDDATELRDALQAVAAKLTTNILAGWRDVPEDEDGFVVLDRDSYHVKLSGRWIEKKFPTREIAMYELAAAMVREQFFPNAWVSDGHGPAEEPLGESFNKLLSFDANGNTVLVPLDGVQYAEGDELILAGTGWPMEVDRDYGPYGVLMHTCGDPSIWELVTDRGLLSRVVENEDERRQET